ncbi:uncharacterized protein BJ212DRAFT_857512 [Suillus subaureus]|uniref:Anaphase-promoting complex subunit 4 WD40 domain-containing protein n=1 Tax=Suillus subaureus TaxID=48587 RepID=A0A9P7DXL6_9AGAM|nr:uncharacterized protein BJ212DRAFT_857512 [Suillus subaureus]KAG1805533.1 hypothetical protein BJ212DRAFT_857512 [Suillus subaureus]
MDDSTIEGPKTIYEFDASTLETVRDPFEGHTGSICGLTLSSDCVLLASASYDTIKLWSFESRQLLASFDVQAPYSLALSPDSCQLAYTTRDEPNIYICDIPVNILASIGLAKETSGPESSHLAKLLNSDATRHTIQLTTHNPFFSAFYANFSLLLVRIQFVPPAPMSLVIPWTFLLLRLCLVHS